MKAGTSANKPFHLQCVVLPGNVKRDVFVVDGRVTFTAPAAFETIVSAGYAVPGLVDMHAHLSLASPAPATASLRDQVRASAQAHLDAGVLAIREPGAPSRTSRSLGPAQGLPRIFTSGRFLTPPGTYFPGLAREVADSSLAQAAEEEARASGGWAKVIGDWVDEDGEMSLNYPARVLAQAVRRVHAIGGRVAIHAVTREALEAGIEAGVDSIEHGEGLADDHIRAMAQSGTALVPTLAILPYVEHALPLAERARKALQPSLKRHAEMTRRAFEAGVLVLAGTDAGLVEHGMIREEIDHLIEAGIPQESALAAASWSAREYLGLPGIEEGAPADIVVYTDDPCFAKGVLYRPTLGLLDGSRISSL